MKGKEAGKRWEIIIEQDTTLGDSTKIAEQNRIYLEQLLTKNKYE
jgi:hypothetical protein